MMERSGTTLPAAQAVPWHRYDKDLSAPAKHP